MLYEFNYPKQDISSEKEFETLDGCLEYLQEEFVSCLEDDDAFYINNIKYRWDEEEKSFFESSSDSWF